MKYSTLFLTILLLSAALIASVPTDHAAYVSGSAAIPNGTGGSMNLEDAKEFRFEYDGGTFTLPYERITSMEVGGKPGVKAHLAVAVSWIPKLGKNQGKLLTIAYKGANAAGEVAIFEIAKQELQNLTPVLEARTGKHIQLLDADEPGKAKDAPAQAPAVVSNMVPVTFMSAPQGATVSFWGQVAGKTPVTTKLAPGTYTVTISASGLPAWTRDIAVEAGKPITVEAELAHPNGRTIAAR